MGIIVIYHFESFSKSLRQNHILVLSGVQNVDVLVGPVHAPVRGPIIEAHVVERLVLLLHAHLCQVSVSEESM